MTFTNHRVVVCGGSRGIGRSIALAFAAAGADVSICARGRDTLEATRAEIARHGHQAHAAHLRPRRRRRPWRATWPSAGAALGGIDVLVNNASGFGMGDDEAGWSAGLSVDVMAMVRASHAALPMLEQSGEGASIIHISSISGFRASTRTPAYAAVKAAMISYTASQAAMLARKRIRVNCIAPGSIEFDGGVWEQRTHGERSAVRPRAEEHSVRPHWARPKRWPRWRCSSPRRMRAGSPGRRSRSTAGNCSAADHRHFDADCAAWSGCRPTSANAIKSRPALIATCWTPSRT